MAFTSQPFIIRNLPSHRPSKLPKGFTGANHDLYPANCDNILTGWCHRRKRASVASNSTLSVTATGCGLTPLNKILYVKQVPPNSDVDIWTANADGSGAQKANIILSAGLRIVGTNAKMSPNGKTIFFAVEDSNGTNSYIYSCSVGGSNVKKVIDGTGADWVSISGAY